MEPLYRVAGRPVDPQLPLESLTDVLTDTPLPSSKGGGITLDDEGERILI